MIEKSDNGNRVIAGEAITYTLTYLNRGPVTASGVMLTEIVPEHTVFDATASGPAVWSCPDQSGAGTTCTLPLGSLPIETLGMTKFVVRVVDPLPLGVDAIVNTATIGDDGNHGPDPTPQDNVDSVTTTIDPTAVHLLSLIALPQRSGVVIRWETGTEINTRGFYILRSSDAQRAHATRITLQLIPARGAPGTGAAYDWTDNRVDQHASSWYWLQEVEQSGAITEYGPAIAPATAARFKIYLPLSMYRSVAGK
jgi:uncharacterized repeat protein (TIGR01451 family)